MCSVCAVTLASSRLRASPEMTQRSATTLGAVPPATTPMLAVVSSSRRPSRIAATARAAATMALRPSSGAMPACAACPLNSAWMRFWVGAPVMSVPGAPSLSSTNTRFAVSSAGVERLGAEQAVLLARREDELHVAGRRVGDQVRASQSRTATAPLSSAPSGVEPSLLTRPSATTTVGAASMGTVSRCAHSPMGSASPRPGMVATRLPHPQPVTTALSSSRRRCRGRRATP